jgi:hypothetical protein
VNPRLSDDLDDTAAAPALNNPTSTDGLSTTVRQDRLRHRRVAWNQ